MNSSPLDQIPCSKPQSCSDHIPFVPRTHRLTPRLFQPSPRWSSMDMGPLSLEHDPEQGGWETSLWQGPDKNSRRLCALGHPSRWHPEMGRAGASPTEQMEHLALPKMQWLSPPARGLGIARWNQILPGMPGVGAFHPPAPSGTMGLIHVRGELSPSGFWCD